jgi:hypothetical protein
MLYLTIALQAVALIPAGFGLWYLWRLSLRGGPLVSGIVTAAFLFRAMIGLVLFWVSFLELPLLRSLQLGGGIWFFGSDTNIYLYPAGRAARAGLLAVLLMPRKIVSVTFVQVLAAASYSFGNVASIGLLVNLAAFLATAVLIQRLNGSSAAGRAAAIAVAALALSPSAILWSLQPLKDTLFCLLIVAEVWCFVRTARQFRIMRERAPTIRLFLPLAGLLAAMYMIAGIRWYFGLVLMGVTAVTLLGVALSTKGRRVLATSVAIVVSFLLAQMMVLASDVHLPSELRRASVPDTMVSSLASLPSRLFMTMDRQRSGFDRLHGRTVIMEKASRPASGEIPSGGPSDAVVVRDNPFAENEGVSTGRPSGGLNLPRSRSARLRLGLIAMFVPRFLSQRLHLLEIGGGRGLWLFAECDTLFFDALILVLLVTMLRQWRQRKWLDPVFWHVGLLTAGITCALCYTVSNFGTLMRHREMVLTGACLLLTLYDRPAQDSDGHLVVGPGQAGEPVISS